jgi:hypothetical protein
MSLGSRIRLWAAQLKTNNQSTFSSPRNLTWRSGPVCYSQPKAFSTSHLRLRLMAHSRRAPHASCAKHNMIACQERGSSAVMVEGK